MVWSQVSPAGSMTSSQERGLMEDSAGSWSHPGGEGSCPRDWAGEVDDSCVGRGSLGRKLVSPCASISDADPTLQILCCQQNCRGLLAALSSSSLMAWFNNFPSVSAAISVAMPSMKWPWTSGELAGRGRKSPWSSWSSGCGWSCWSLQVSWAYAVPPTLRCAGVCAAEGAFIPALPWGYSRWESLHPH